MLVHIVFRQFQVKLGRSPLVDSLRKGRRQEGLAVKPSLGQYVRFRDMRAYGELSDSHETGQHQAVLPLIRATDFLVDGLSESKLVDRRPTNLHTQLG